MRNVERYNAHVILLCQLRSPPDKTKPQCDTKVNHFSLLRYVRIDRQHSLSLSFSLVLLRLEDRIARGKEQKSGKPFWVTRRETHAPYCHVSLPVTSPHSSPAHSHFSVIRYFFHLEAIADLHSRTITVTRVTANSAPEFPPLSLLTLCFYILHRRVYPTLITRRQREAERYISACAFS